MDFAEAHDAGPLTVVSQLPDLCRLGAISRRNCNRLPARFEETKVRPVMLPPGLARLVTRPPTVQCRRQDEIFGINDASGASPICCVWSPLNSVCISE